MSTRAPETELDISAREARVAFEALRARVGLRADVFVGLRNHNDKPLCATIYPYGVTKDAHVSAYGETFSELLSAAEAAWDAGADERRAKVVASMALAIIRITDTLGECSDAALRAEFTRDDAENCGPDACARADEMAAHGPFTITPSASANAPDSFDDEAA